MSFISLIVRFPSSENGYLIKLDNDLSVEDLCAQIRLKIKEADVGNPSNYGIFIPDPDPKHSFWLENWRMISYYNLTENFEVEYRFKMRLLVVQTMDGTRKTLQVDDSKTVAEIMNTVCAKMGITNHEEYSLLRPIAEDEKLRMSTLKRKKNTDREHEKLEKLKQKLHMDDDLNWLAHGKTLRQHGIEESDVLILKRKYFFADQNVDTRDPVQLNLLYLQLKEAILNGTHPISLDQAIQLAALQCQAELGVLTNEKAKLNPIDLKGHLPKEYWKTKNVEKRIQEAHKKLGEFDEREAKLRYVQLCRSLPTYGITFFLIKEKLKGRNKLVPRLFGVSKESVMRVDEKTKEILETWPLTRIRRWAAGTNLFTLDFGDYNPDGNYAMKTTEGEQIGQLISGYIDIILRKQRCRQTALNDTDENNTIVEENVAPSRANVIANIGNTLPRGHKADEAWIATEGTLGRSNYHGVVSEGHLATREVVITEQNLNGAHIGSGRIVQRNGILTHTNGTDPSRYRAFDLPHPKRALLSRIDMNLRVIKEAAEELDTPIYPDEEALRGDDGATKRWRSVAIEQARQAAYSHLGAMTMAAGQLISSLHSTDSVPPGDEYDYTSMDASLVSIGVNANSLMQCIRLYEQLDAADNSSDRAFGESLKQAAQQLSDAFIDLINSARPSSDSFEQVSSPLSESTLSLPANAPDRAALLEAAGRVGDASRQLLQLIGQGSPVISKDEDQENGRLNPLYPPVVDWEARDRLLSATKCVANRMADMVKIAKSGAVSLDEELDKTDANSATHLRASQSRLVHAATAAGKCASRLVTCAKVVVCTMEQPESQDQLIRAVKEVSASANGVSDAVNDLIRVSLDFAHIDGRMHESHLRLGDALHEAVLAVHEGLNELVECLQSTTIQAHQDPVVSTLLSAATQIPSSVGDARILIDKANSLATAASDLVAELRSDVTADSTQIGLSTSEAKRRADVLESEVERLKYVAQLCANGNAQSVEHQQMVVEAAQQLFAVAQATSAPIIRARLTRGLEFATRLTASNVGPLVTVGGEVVRISQGKSFQLASSLEQLQKRVMPQVSLSCSDARVEPYNLQKQSNLLEASQTLMKCLEEMLRITDAVVPTIPDPAVQTAFSGAARNTQSCLSDLRVCLNNYEPVLSARPESEQSFDGAEELRSVCLEKSTKSLDLLNSVLRTKRLLPDETIDSVCIGLWNAVARYNRSFPIFEPSSEESDKICELEDLPGFVGRLFNPDSGPATRKDWHRVSNTVDELLERLTPLLNGIRGLSAILSAASTAPVLDKSLARVLMVSHGLIPKRQSTLSGRSSMSEGAHPSGSLLVHSDESQAQSTANDMLAHLLSIGQSCLTDCNQLINLALQPGSISVQDENTLKMAVLAEQLSTSVNAVLGYVPGEVIVRRLLALLEDKNSLPAANHASSTRDSTFEPSAKLISATRRLAKVCSDASGRISYLGRGKTIVDSDESPVNDAFGHDSRVTQLAYLADRVTDALGEMIHLFKLTSGCTQMIGILAAVGLPVATGFRQAIRSAPTVHRKLGDYGDLSVWDASLQQALLKLRDWALDIGCQAETQMQTTPEPSDRSDQISYTEDVATLHMRSQCEAAIRRLNALTQFSTPFSVNSPISPRPVQSTSCSVLLPSSNQTFHECYNELHSLGEEIKSNSNSIPKMASNRDADSFCAAVQSLTQATCQLLQVSNQSAYLVAASHPASKPGHSGPLTESDQLATLHDHVAAVRKGSSELNRAEDNSSTEEEEEMIKIAIHMAQRATQLCQLSRPLLSDYNTSHENRTLAESLERVARKASALFKVTQSDKSVDSATIIRQLRSGASQLEEAVDSHAEVLFQFAGGSPTQLAEEALSLQTPILDSSQTVLANSLQLVEFAQHLVSPETREGIEAAELYEQARRGLQDALEQLMEVVNQLVPGVEACNHVISVVTHLVSELDDAALQLSTSEKPPSGISGRLEISLNLIRSSLQQLDQQASDVLFNWKQSRWELLAHDVYNIGNYLPSLTKECVQSAGGLCHHSDQSNLLTLGRTVLEASQQLLNCLTDSIRNELSPSSAPRHNVEDYANQLKQACSDLLSHVDGVAQIQGGIAWHVASINTACSKLDDPQRFNLNDSSNNSAHNTSSPPDNFVSSHTHLSQQLRALLTAANRVSQQHSRESNADSTARANAIAAMSQVFLQLVASTKSITFSLTNGNQSESRLDLANRLCHGTQALGAACSEFLRAPLHRDRHNNLVNRADDLKAVLQSCAPGADACATAASNLGRLIADLDTACLFARAGTLVDQSVSSETPVGKGPSVSPKPRSFQLAQESALNAAKELAEDIQMLTKNASTDQTALSVSAKNCFSRASALADAIKSTASRAAHQFSSANLSADTRVESQVQLLTAARDVISCLIQLLNHAKSVTATRYAIEAWPDSAQEGMLSSREKHMNDYAVRIVENLAQLSQSVRGLNSIICPAKPSTSPKPTSILPALRTTGTPAKASPRAQDEPPEKTSVRAGLRSVVDALKQLEQRFVSWKVEQGKLCRPDYDYDVDPQHYLDLKPTPNQLVQVSRSITQAAIKANSATASGKLSEISMAAQALRKSAEDLARVLPAACDLALSSISSKQTEDAEELSAETVQAACAKAVAGAASTCSELQLMVDYIIATLDAGASSPAGVQVTLAMRRLRETVHEIVESAMNFPGAKEASIEITPTIAPKPIPVTLRPITRHADSGSAPAPPTPKPLTRKSSLLTNPQHQAEVEQSIADANATAAEVSAPAQKELGDMVGQLERNVHLIGQLHSKRSPAIRKTVRFTTTQDEPDSANPVTIDPVPTTCSVENKISADNLDSAEGLDSVISACQHVVHTTLSLMYWAAAAQRELVQQGRLKPIIPDASGTDTESQWSQGLISAARYVAAAANCVVESAQAMVAARLNSIDVGALDNAHSPKPEALISAAQTTAACTAQLVVACMAKADPSSKSFMGLRQAGAGVRLATENLVRLVQSFSPDKGLSSELTTPSSEGFNTGMVASMREVIETKSSIAAKQRELESLHTKLKHIHQDQYRSHEP